jgi:translation initiation factor 2B subunit (eIF-2B alpha/beta/delta family)
MQICQLLIQHKMPNTDGGEDRRQRRDRENINQEILETQRIIADSRAQNEIMNNLILDMKRKLQDLKTEKAAANDKSQQAIDDARRRLEQANNDYAQFATMKASLEKEIATYRGLLESNAIRVRRVACIK